MGKEKELAIMEAYTQGDMPTRVLYKRFRIASVTLYELIRKYKAPLRTSPRQTLSVEQEIKLIADYQNTAMTVEDVLLQNKTNTYALYKVLKKHNVPRRVPALAVKRKYS